MTESSAYDAGGNPGPPTRSRRWSIYIPDNIISAKGWNKGDDVIFIPTDTGIELRRTIDIK